MGTCFSTSGQGKGGKFIKKSKKISRSKKHDKHKKHKEDDKKKTKGKPKDDKKRKKKKPKHDKKDDEKKRKRKPKDAIKDKKYVNKKNKKPPPKVKKAKEKKKSKFSSKENKDAPLCVSMESEYCRNKREQMLWDTVVKVFDMESPDMIVLLKASETALKLSREDFKERVELEKKVKSVWLTQQDAKEIAEKLSYGALMGKAKWRKHKARSGQYNNKKFKDATDKARVKYKTLKREANNAKNIAEECFYSHQRIVKLAAEKLDIFNQRISKVDAAIALFKDREILHLNNVKKGISDAEYALNEAIEQKDVHKLIMDKAKKGYEEATACFMQMEDSVSLAKYEYENEVMKVTGIKKMIIQCDKMKKEIDARKVTFNGTLYEDEDKDSEVITDSKQQ